MSSDALSARRPRRTVRAAARSVFDDLNVPQSPVEEEKVRIAMAINDVLVGRARTQSERAMALGVAQPVVSNLERLELGGISLERLLRYARHLGIEVQIKVLPSRAG